MAVKGGERRRSKRRFPSSTRIAPNSGKKRRSPGEGNRIFIFSPSPHPSTDRPEAAGGLNSHTAKGIKSPPSADFWGHHNKQAVDELQKSQHWASLENEGVLNTGSTTRTKQLQRRCGEVFPKDLPGSPEAVALPGLDYELSPSHLVSCYFIASGLKR